MPSIELGDVRVTAIDAGSLWLDGGAMFGVVPKPLWSRRTQPDDRNRIPLAMRCLLVETADARILIDTGVGSKETEKFLDIYRVHNEGVPTRLEDSLRMKGVEPTDIDIVLNTHLHFDHAGGNTLRHSDGSIVPAFPDATYHVGAREWEFAHLDNERVKASYLPENFDPLVVEDRVRFIEGNAEIVPGVQVMQAPGHTPGHQVVLLGTGNDRMLYLADLAPTVAHLPLPWIMGYDVEPLVTLESKRGLLASAVEHRWAVAFEHDPSMAWGRIVESDRGRVELVDTESHRIAGTDNEGE
jgi:glyoxylase-like metal-dependent hydrolase (beta-lactamase superfamily II)